MEPVDKDKAKQRRNLIHIIMTHVVMTKNPSSNEKEKLKYQLEGTTTKALKQMRKRCNMRYYKKRNSKCQRLSGKRFNRQCCAWRKKDGS